MNYSALLVMVMSVLAQTPASPPSADGLKEAVKSEAHSESTSDAFDKRLESIDTAMAKVVDVRANFEQRKHTPLLKKPLVSKGTLITRGEAVRWDTQSPRRSTMLVGGGQIKLYYPDDALVEVYQVGGDAKDIASTPMPRLVLLRSRFDLSPMSAQELGALADKPHMLGVMLRPKTQELRRHVRSVEVLIDDSVPVASRVILTDAEGERTEITFSSVRVNSGTKQEEIELRLPEGVRVSRPLGTKPGEKTPPESSPPVPEVPAKNTP